MLPSLARIPIFTAIDGKRKLGDTNDLPLELVSSLVKATLQWTTHKVRFQYQIDKDTMRHTVVRNAQGGFEVDVHFRFARSSIEKHVTITLPAPFEAPQDLLTQHVDQNTYDVLERAIWNHAKGLTPQLDDFESFGTELTDLIRTVMNEGPWKDLGVQYPRIRLHRDASTRSPKWHNDASNPLSEEIITFYVRYNGRDEPLDDERMPRFVKGPVPWVDMVDVAQRVLHAVGYNSTVTESTLGFTGGPLDSLQSTYDHFIREGVKSGIFTVHYWPKRSFVRVSGTFHVGPPPRRKRPGQDKIDERKGRIIISFRTGRTVADSMRATSLEQ